MSTAEPFKSKQVGVNYVSRSLDSFYPAPEPKASVASTVKRPTPRIQKTIIVDSVQPKFKKQHSEKVITTTPQTVKKELKQKILLPNPKIIAVVDPAFEKSAAEPEQIQFDKVDLEEMESPPPEVIETKSQNEGVPSSLAEVAAQTENAGSKQDQISVVKRKAVSQISQEFKDALPRYDVNPPPRYPEVAKLRGWEGKVVFEALILKSGRVGHLDIVASSGYRSLDNAARKAISRWKFSPATSFGLSIDSQVEIPVTFSLKDL